MNKKYILILSLIFISYQGIGQTVPDIVGTYDRSHHGDPQGASKLFVLKDHKYVIVFFGGAQTGTWNIGEDSLVTFEPAVTKERFTIYGRHNKDLGDSTRIGFMDFTSEDTFIHFGDPGKEKPVMKKVFNDSPNCLSFPYLYKYKGVAPQISFVNKPYQREGDEVAVQDLYTFQNPEHYNDFIAYFFKEARRKRPLTAIAKKGRLYFEEDDSEEKGPLPDRKEELDMIMAVSHIEVNPAEVYFNPFYGQYEKDVKNDKLNYTYNEAKGAYISPGNYKEGEEYKKDDESFNRMYIIYAFKAIQPSAKVKRPYDIDQVPLFTVKCKEEN